MIKINTILIVAALSCGAFAQDTLPKNYQQFNDGLSLALKALKMTIADFSLRDDYVEKDAYRMAKIDHLMKEPLELVPLANRLLTADLAGEIISPVFREAPYPMLLKPRVYQDIAPESTMAKYFTKENLDKATLYRLAFFVTKVERFLSDPVFADQYKASFDSILFGYTLLLEENVEDETKSVDQLDSIAKYEEDWTKRLVDLTRTVDAEVPALRCLDFLGVFDDSLINHANPNLFIEGYLEYATPYGKICIGDTGSQYYYGDIFMVIDYGGNDIYEIDKKDNRNFTIILDYGGNDVYNLPQSRFPAYGLGANIIVDFAGNDTYNGNSWSLGAGFFGCGILWDKKGNDHYYGDTFTMGAGCFGFGILRDDAGDDFYQAALYSQGFGFTEGIGVLSDNSGNDHYFAGGKYKDILRYSDHYLSLSQGFGYGVRPYLSGGIGYLIDKAGNDTYESDIFAQGCSYWWSLGVLADGSGNDKYLSYQYAQGCATHMTVGCLYDASGDDLYCGKGLMQGVGHDRAYAICYDGGGNDNYIASDLSQGAGSANGTGILCDIDGADSYVVKDNVNTQGYGNPRRDYGSIGIFLDLNGKDSYSGGKGADSTWWGNSNWGVGIDK
jgi:hypothetical protein